MGVDETVEVHQAKPDSLKQSQTVEVNGEQYRVEDIEESATPVTTLEDRAKEAAKDITFITSFAGTHYPEEDPYAFDVGLKFDTRVDCINVTGTDIHEVLEEHGLRLKYLGSDLDSSLVFYCEDTE